MGLVDEARGQLGRPGTQCLVAVFRATLSPADLSDFDEAVLEPDVTAMALSRALKARGTTLPYHSINRHRRGDCKCP